MRKFTPIAILFLLLASFSAHAQEQLVTQSTTTMLPAKNQKLNSDRKDKLSGIVSNRAFTGSTSLLKDTLLTVLSRQNYTAQIDMSSGNRAKAAKRIRRAMQVAYVEVASGQQEGLRGWVVVGYRDKGGGSRTYLSAPSSKSQAARQTKAVASSHSKANAPDLSASVSRGGSTFQVAGKKVFSVSIANAGGVGTRGNFVVTVEVNGKTIKTEKVRAIPSRGSHYFNVEVSESAIRRHHTLKVTVDKGNRIEEADEANNIFTQRL